MEQTKGVHTRDIDMYVQGAESGGANFMVNHTNRGKVAVIS